ncbi:DNA-processing protein DprA [Catenulispora rubra]|uniref:DNA-processing protein DprA n=1 Tax=Catenulispora rubra TaxID=280293 RepID=UPI0018922DA7|nr:DNA-processing protein DprA [Catenulispora rubra]
MSTDLREQAALIALLRRGGRNWQEIAGAVERAGSATRVLKDEPDGQDALFELEEQFDLSDIEDEITKWRGKGFGFLTLLDADYPARLRMVHQRPPFLFANGTLAPDDLAVAVVGTREPSPRGLSQASAIAEGLAQRGVTVVSGLAKGIDAAAHRACLDAGGRTVAVIGTGIRRSYPAQNAELQREIVHKGLVLSQFWPDAPPTKQSFPMRNAVMSGYALATVVIEAAYQSGARMQARLALEHGRHVFLMKSLLMHEWAREYAQRPNATVVESAEEVFQGLDGLFPAPDELVWT